MMATTPNPLNVAPDFTQVRDSAREVYLQFFELTAPENIENYANGANLESLAELASRCRNIIEGTCPIIDGQQQWKLNRLSEVKERLSQAVECKRRYYDNHIFGIVTKYVLQFLDCFGFKMWNNGDTAAIVTAENFLLFWDSRAPVYIITNPESSQYGEYQRRQDFPPRRDIGDTPIDLSRFYNYNPRRTIEVPGYPDNVRINYAELRA
ncbi:MAG: hypothetical protein KF898_00920 [Parachlamydiales bacterium]|nr:hypothetical protein [Candidatus Acheromyda pituitae]